MPAEKPPLFISHATSGLHSSDRTVQLRDLTARYLAERGWAPFLDAEKLKAGYNWRSTILANLARARAGITFFNRRAAEESKWVAAEALILCFRRSLDPEFQFVRVFLEGTRIHDTCFGRYEPFEMNNIQALKDDPGLPVETIAQQIADRFDPVRASRPDPSPWVNRVMSLLSRVEMNALVLAAGELQLSIEEYMAGDRNVSGEMIRRAIVQLFHHLPPEESLGAFRHLVTALDRAQASQLSACFTAKWVANESIETLMCVSRPEAPSRLLSVSAARQEDLQEYLNRAKIELDRGTVWAFSVAGAPGEGDEMGLARVEFAIRESMLGADSLLADENVELPLPAAVTEVMSNPEDVAICALPRDYASAIILRELSARYPRIVFIAQAAGTVISDAMAQCGVRGLPPPLTPELHNRLVKLKSRIKATVDSVHLA